MPDLPNRAGLDPSYVLRIEKKTLPEDLAMRLMSWEFEDVEKMDKLTLVFDNTDLAILDDPRLILGAIVEFRHGYTTEMSDWKLFTVSGVSGFKERRVECLEVIRVFATEQKCRSWPAATLVEVVAQIAGEAGLEFETQKLVDDKGVELKLDYYQPKVHDMAFLFTLGRKIGYEIWIEEDTLYFMPRQYWQDPYLEFTYNGLNGQVLDFKPAENSMEKRSKTSGGGIDLTTKNAFFVTENGSTRMTHYLGKTFFDYDKVVGQYKDYVEGQIVRIPMRTRAEADAILAGKWTEEMSDQITAELHLIGEPKLKARKVIIVSNVGKYSGRYYVKSVLHSISGGYTSVATLTRNAAFDKEQKYSAENIATLVNENRVSVKEFLEQTKNGPKGKFYARLFNL